MTHEQKKLAAALRACARACKEFATSDHLSYEERARLVDRHYRASSDAYNWLRFVDDPAEREAIEAGIHSRWEAAKAAVEEHRQAVRDEATRRARAEYRASLPRTGSYEAELYMMRGGR